MEVLVTGASGHVGRHVVAGLAAAGARVRAASRTPGRLSLPVGVTAVAGDLTDPPSLDGALRGADALYLFPVPETADAVLARAVAAGVRRVVVLSSSAVDDPGNHSGVYHRRVEEAVERAGVEWTFVRPDEFATNVYWKWGASIRAEGVVRAPYPRAASPVVHEADVAAVATAALLQDGHAGRAYPLTGPAAVDQIEQVACLARAAGRDIRFEEVEPARAREAMTATMPEPVVDMVLAHLAETEARPPAVLPTVARVTGRPALPFSRWAADHTATLLADTG